MRKSNPPLLEWLSSPIVYKETALPGRQAPPPATPPIGVQVSEIPYVSQAQKLRDAVAEFHSPVSSYHHYLHMAQGNYREYLKGDIVSIKKYFYVLRPLLAIRWIETRKDPVPMEFEKLVENSVTSTELKETIADLVERKRSGQELDQQPKIPAISDFIESELERLTKDAKPQDRSKPNFEKLNELFRDALIS